MARQCPQGKFVSGGKGNAPPGIQISGVKFDMEGLRQMAKDSESIVLNSVQFDESLFTDDISLTVEPDTSEDNGADLMLPDYLLYVLISLDWDYMSPDNDVPYWHPIRRALQEYGIDLLEILQQNLWILDGFQPVLPDTLTTDTLVVILSHITEEASMSDEHSTWRSGVSLKSTWTEISSLAISPTKLAVSENLPSWRINMTRQTRKTRTSNSDSDYDIPDLLDGSDSEDEEDSPKQHTFVEDIQEDALEQSDEVPAGPYSFSTSYGGGSSEVSEVTSVLGPYPSHPNEEIVAFVPKDYPSWESRRGIWRYRRFNVRQFGLSDDPPPRAIDSYYYDTELPSEIEIRTSWLETPDFCIVQWYADERSRMNGLTPHLDWPVGAPWNGAGRNGRCIT
ncbi:hypothetical protein BDZ89DRAFT_1254923 [Hymenopellis radicata]|nr:hypothetical protein BDZ89DRAFT_1254923 [Hymenopellis radicata]